MSTFRETSARVSFKEPPKPSLLKFLGVELKRSYALEFDEEQYSARREKVYTFLKIPKEAEKFMAYGFFQCADSFLFVYTFLPFRFLIAILSLVSRCLSQCFVRRSSSSQHRLLLRPAEICDIIKATILILCSCLMCYVDTSMMYHLIKSQSVIKLYIFYNMLEVGDRLFSSFGQDTIDALFWTATEPRDKKRQHLGVIPHYLIALVYVFLHGVLVLLQATTLNVAINSNNKALLTIMLSNNFVELKGSVFKKFDKSNLFQVTCSDIRERFHLFVLLLIVVVQTMKELNWAGDRLWMLIVDCIFVLLAEVIVDWLKHCFITKFNELPFHVYQDYTLSLAYDMAQTRQKNAFIDHSDLVARRMGFIPLPLGVVMIRVLMQSLRIHGPVSVLLVILAYTCLFTLRIFNNIIILGKACYLIHQHQQEHRPSTPLLEDKLSSLPPRSLSKDSATSPMKCTTPGPGHAPGFRRSNTVDSSSPTLEPNETTASPQASNLVGPAIFSNSNVSIKDACLNEEMLRVAACGMESIGEVDNENLTRSVPNIQQEEDLSRSRPEEIISPSPSTEMFKRAESEPNLSTLTEDT
uniref:Protein TAPT1 homolog n=1 Tax=Cacopsylla melanoneura TaxID=428564 RepID=A0A8D8LKT5_9HEMI